LTLWGAFPLDQLYLLVQNLQPATLCVRLKDAPGVKTLAYGRTVKKQYPPIVARGRTGKEKTGGKTVAAAR
jgi:hypothetical protein